MSAREFVDIWLEKALQPGPYLAAIPRPTTHDIEKSMMCDAAEAGIYWEEFEATGVELQPLIAAALEKFYA